MAKDQKQHYIPEFYQKQWAGPDGRLCEYSVRYNGAEGRMTHPAGSGCKPGVYTIPGVAPEIANYTETVFLSRSLDSASHLSVRASTRAEFSS